MGSLYKTTRGLVLVLAATVWLAVAPVLWRVAETWEPRDWFVYGPTAALVAAALWSIASGLLAYLRWRMDPPRTHEMPTGAVVP